MNLVVGFRKTGTKTPFLSRVLDGEDAFLGRPLTDSELAEECMGGMYVPRTLDIYSTRDLIRGVQLWRQWDNC